VLVTGAIGPTLSKSGLVSAHLGQIFWAAAQTSEESIAPRITADHEPQAMAGELHVHPQTVWYRMAQLRELFWPALEGPTQPGHPGADAGLGAVDGRGPITAAACRVSAPRMNRRFRMRGREAMRRG
jgi:hypothetical protein